MRTRKLLSYLSYIGIPFISVCSSYAQYPDAESLLGRLGIKIGEDGKPVADGTGGCLPRVFADLLAGSTTEKLTQLCGNKMALEENRWNNHCIPYKYDSCLAEEMGIIPNEADLYRIGDLVRSREFLTGVFGEDFVLEFLETVAESSGKVYTDLISRIDFQVYRCLCEKLQTLEREKVRGKKDKKDSIVENYRRCGEEYLKLQGEIKSQIAECEELLKKYVPQNEGYKLLWKTWSVFDKISYDSNQKEVLLAEKGFLKELGCVPDLQKNNEHPVWIALSKVRALLPKYLESCSLLKEALIRKRKKEEEEEVRNEIRKKPFEEYRKRFAGEGYLTNEETGKKIPISTEPVTVDIRIYQQHFEDANGARKLYGEDWKRRVEDLGIKLRLVIDTRTKKLLSAFCKDEFIVNGQVVTYFGSNGSCIFKANSRKDLLKR